MLINVINANTEAAPVALEVDPSTDIGTLKSLIEVEIGIPVLRQVIKISGSDRQLNDDDTMRSLGLQDQDLLAVEDRGGANRGILGTEQLMDRARQDSRFMRLLDQKSPALAAAIRNRDTQAVMTELQKTMRTWNPFGRADAVDPRASADPLSAEGQAYALERITQAEIDANRAYAYEYMPEAFVDIHMLYIRCEVNGVPIMAFVDSGAQHTIMSEDCACRCNLERLIDKRYQGLAKGVGSARVIGRVHLAQLQCGRSFFPASFTVIENQTMDCLLGLDLLRRHQCCVDLKKGVLRFGGHTEVPFMSEVEIRQYQEQQHKGNSRDHNPTQPDQPRTNPMAAPQIIPMTAQPQGLLEQQGQTAAMINAPKPAESMYSSGVHNLTASDNSSPATGAPVAAQAAPQGRRRPGDHLGMSPNAGDLFRSRRVHTQDIEHMNYGGRMILEQKVKQLVDLGFTKEKAMEALEKCKGDTELAAALLFQSTGNL